MTGTTGRASCLMHFLRTGVIGSLLLGGTPADAQLQP